MVISDNDVRVQVLSTLQDILRINEDILNIIKKNFAGYLQDPAVSKQVNSSGDADLLKIVQKGVQDEKAEKKKEESKPKRKKRGNPNLQPKPKPEKLEELEKPKKKRGRPPKIREIVKLEEGEVEYEIEDEVMDEEAAELSSKGTAAVFKEVVAPKWEEHEAVIMILRHVQQNGLVYERDIFDAIYHFYPELTTHDLRDILRVCEKNEWLKKERKDGESERAYKILLAGEIKVVGEM